MPKSIEWSRLAVEGAVIVASILSAFAIDALWDVRSERVHEQSLLRAIEVEMQTNRADIDRVLSNNRRFLEAAELFLGMTPEQLRSLPSDSVQIVAGVTGTSTFDPSVAFLSNPSLADLRDPTLLREIGAWSQQLTNEQAAASLLDNAIWEVRAVGGEVAPEFFLSEQRAEGLGKLRASPRFVGVQIALQTVRGGDVRMLSRLASQTDSILALVRENLDGGPD